MIKADRGLYQRANQIVFVAETPVKASRGRDVVTLRIYERGDHALREDLAASANFERYDKRAKACVSVDPPTSIVRTLKERIGTILSGVVTAPTMRADGSIINAPGYDEATGLLFDPHGAEFPSIPDHSTRGDAERALALLCVLEREDSRRSGTSI